MLAWVMNLGFAASSGPILPADIGKFPGFRAQFNNIFPEILTNVVPINPSSLLNSGGVTIPVVFPGAVLGDMVLFAAPYDLQDITVTAYVSLPNVIEVRVQNEGGATVDLAFGVWKFAVLKTNPNYFM